MGLSGIQGENATLGLGVSACLFSYDWRRSSTGHRRRRIEALVLSHLIGDKPLIVIGSNRATQSPVDIHAADIGHEGPWLAGNIRADIPAIGLRIERQIGQVFVVDCPLVLGSLGRRDGGVTLVAHPGDTVADPLHMLFYRDDHVAQH